MPPEEGEIEEELDEELEVDPNLSEEEPGEGEAEEEIEEITVAIGDEEPTPEENEPAPGWVKELRKSHRQTQKENRDLKRRLDAKEGDKQGDLGEKPTLEGCDFDTKKYDKDLSGWYERKRDNELKQEKETTDKKDQEQAWQSTLDAYEEKKSKLKVKDFEDAEAFVEETLSVAQQGMILSAADDPALLVYAIGRNPKKAKELAAIKDPVKFAFAVSKLETQLKVTPRKATTKPEKQVSGTGSMSGGSDATLKKLRDKAEKTGDYSAVTKYNREKRRKAS